MPKGAFSGDDMHLIRQNSIIRLSVLIIAIVGLTAWGINGGWVKAQQSEPQSLETSFLYIETGNGKVQFTVELAVSSEERATGLMYRQAMPMNHGMLFQNPSQQRSSFWMRNTFFSLDVIFIRRDGRIANIVRNTMPQSLAQIRSRGRVLGVLELNAGVAERLGIQEGDIVWHAIFDNDDESG